MRHTITGRVAIDGTGRRGIQVSNGETLVATGASGTYRIRVDTERHRFVFVVVPDNARPSGDFFRSVSDCVHQESSADFLLVSDPQKRRKSFSIAQATDLHLRIGGKVALSQGALHRELVNSLTGWSPAFVVLTGDLTDKGDVPSLRALRKAITGLPCPAFPMFGGHDGVEERERPGVRPEDPRTRNYESVLGPTYYSFDWGGRHFVLFPNEEAFFAPPEREVKSAWLKADLKRHRDKETILFMHVPPSLKFLDGLPRSQVAAVCCAHFHSSRALVYRGIRLLNTPAFPFGGIDTSPRSYRRFVFKAGKMSSGLVLVVSRVKGETDKPVRRGRSSQLRLLWSRRVKGQVHRAAPVIQDKRVLISVQDESLSGRQGVVCLNRETGRKLWHFQTDASVKNSVAVSGGSGVAISVTGRLTGFDLAQGALRWQVDLQGHPDRWIYGAPAIGDGVVFAGGKAGYGAFCLESGRQIWYTDPSETGTDAWPCFAGPVVVKDLVVLYLQRFGVVALDKSSGSVAWRRKLDTDYMFPGVRRIDDDVVVAAGGGHLFRLRGTTGRTVWQKQISPEAPLATLGTDVEAGLIFSGNQDGELLACSAKGRLKWRFQAGKELLDATPYRRNAGSITSSPVRIGSGYLVTTTDGNATLVDARTGASTERWWFGAPITASPCVAEGCLVISDFGGLTAGFTFEK
jgi:outer membrane protein assembly factor BamB